MSTLEIKIAQSNRSLTITAPVKDSLHGSMLSDRINNLPYLKVSDREYKNGRVEVKCHTIRGLYSIEKLHTDLDTMSDLIVESNEKTV